MAPGFNMEVPPPKKPVPIVAPAEASRKKTPKKVLPEQPFIPGLLDEEAPVPPKPRGPRDRTEAELAELAEDMGQEWWKR